MGVSWSYRMEVRATRGLKYAAALTHLGLGVHLETRNTVFFGLTFRASELYLAPFDNYC